MAKRLLAVAAVLGLVIGLFAGAIGSASAEQVPGSNITSVFFPWVPNGETMDGVGPYYGSVTIQNIENFRINIMFGPTAGSVSPSLNTTLEAHASKTFTAAQLGLAGTGGGVVATASWWFDPQNSIFPPSCTSTGTVVETKITRGSTANGSDVLPVANATGISYVSSGTGDTGTIYSTPTDYVYSNGSISWAPPGAEPAAGSSYYVGAFVAHCVRGPQIAGVEKQAAPSTNAMGTMTAATNLSVDGYTGMPDTDVAWGPASAFCNIALNNQPNTGGPGENCNGLGTYNLGIPTAVLSRGADGGIGFDGHSYLPIVQANWSGWDSFIHLTNVDASSGSFAAAVVEFFPADQGTGNAVAVDNLTISSGSTATIDVASYLKSVGITSFVGSAWITSDYGVVASANRVKASTDMTLTNTSAPSLFATTSLDSGALGALGALPYNPLLAPVGTSFNPGFQMYAPLVYKDYNGWNTGINVANISEIVNQVTVTIYNRDGTAVGSYTDAIPAKGMHYFYIPASQDQGLGNGDFGSAVISGQLPFHAAIDEVKYGAAGNDQAMSYIATAANITDLAGLCPPDFRAVVGACAEGNTLALPLFQKGNGSHGDTSGINMFNPRGVSVSGNVDFFLSSGAAEEPSQNGTVPFTIAPYSQTYVYAPNMAQMPTGSQLSAVVTADFNANDIPSALGSIVAVSNNVNYDVAGDGSSVFNLVNQNGDFRFVCSQSNCGLLVVGPGGSLFLLPPDSFFAGNPQP